MMYNIMMQHNAKMTKLDFNRAMVKYHKKMTKKYRSKLNIRKYKKLNIKNILSQKIKFADIVKRDNSIDGTTQNSYSKHLQMFISTLNAKDDAVEIHMTNVKDIMSGKTQMAFNHVHFLLDMFKQIPCYDKYVKSAALLLTASIYRNMLIINGVNQTFCDINARDFTKHLHMKHVTEEMDNIFNNKRQLITDAILLNVDISKYIDHGKNIDDDIEGCSNGWNQNQKLDTYETAADSVIIIKDINNESYVLTIVRKNAPGIGNVAFPGGFVDPTDRTVKNAALRELEEETGFDELNITTYASKTEHQLPVHNTYCWDPRGKFPLGMETCGLGIHYELTINKS